jgi:hypothetical protein
MTIYLVVAVNYNCNFYDFGPMLKGATNSLFFEIKLEIYWSSKFDYEIARVNIPSVTMAINLAAAVNYSCKFL